MSTPAQQLPPPPDDWPAAAPSVAPATRPRRAAAPAPEPAVDAALPPGWEPLQPGELAELVVEGGSVRAEDLPPAERAALAARRAARAGPDTGAGTLGSRQGITAQFLDALAADFAEHGMAAIRSCRVSAPNTYLRTVAALLPAKVDLDMATRADPARTLVAVQADIEAAIERRAQQLADERATVATVQPRRT